MANYRNRTEGEAAFEELYLREFPQFARPENHRAKFKYFRPPLNPTQEKAYDCAAKYSLFHGERGSGKCSEPEVCVYTKTGLSRLIRLRPNELPLDDWIPTKEGVIGFDGKSLKPVTTDGFYTERSTVAKELQFSNGNTLKCSPIHPLWGAWTSDGQIHFGYKTSTEIQLAISNGQDFYVPLFAHPNFTHGNYKTVEGVKLSENVGYTLGVLAGDGSLNQSGAIGLTCADQEIIEGIRSGISEMGGAISKHAHKYSYGILGKRVRIIIRALGMKKLSVAKRIPDAIIESPPTVLCAFLRGLFDTDGTTEKNGEICYCSASERLSWDVQNALQALGIFSTRQYHHNKHAGSWRVNIYGEDTRTYKDKIGFLIARKLSRILPAPKITNRNNNGYPPFIVQELRRLKMENVCFGRKSAHWKPFTPKESKRKRTCSKWEVFGKLDGHYFYKSFSSREDATSFANLKNYERSKLVAHQRDWHYARRSLMQCKYVPSPDKLKRIMEIVGTSETLERLQLSSRWVSVKSVRDTTSSLVDLSVPETRSFVANGLINHNTACALHKLVNHCYTTKNALAILIVLVKRGAEEGGAWHKLIVDVLPQWKKGANLDWDGPKTNTAKDTFVWVTNRFGGWSRILLLSMPVDAYVKDRIKGMEPSFVMIDEAQTLESDSYFKFVVQQVFRRPDAPLQQVVYCANPAGPAHWLYQRFFVMPVTDKFGNPKDWDPNYAVFHVPISENAHNLPPGYYESVLEACRDDEIEERRMVHGEWVDAPEGDALFEDDFIEDKHMIGDVAAGQGIIPVKGFPIQIGYDLGAAHSSITFEQFLATKEKLLWVVFDEIVTTDSYMPYPVLVPRIVKRMDYWLERGGYPFRFEHISDNSAFNQFRAASGSFDHQDVEALSQGRIRMWECPKGPGSVETRVRQTKEKLNDSAIYISRLCPKTKEMFLKLPCDKSNRMTPQKASRFRHPFDSKTYPHLFYGSTRKNQPTRIQVGQVEQACYSLGGG